MEDFFNELEECLRGEVSDTELRDSMDYYHEYFREERSRGKSDEEILFSLGSPRLIARSIIDAGEAAQEQQQGRYTNSGYVNEDESYSEYSDMEDPEREQKGRNGAIIRTVLLLIVILIVIGMLIRVLLPVILVGIAVLLIAGLFQRRG